MGARPDTKKIGAKGERICVRYLQATGFRILKCNWYCRWGEIDIIASINGELVFTEVKTITSNNYCSAKELFNPAKRLRLLRTIKIFLSKQHSNIENWRFDLVCVIKDGNRLWLEYYKNVLA